MWNRRQLVIAAAVFGLIALGLGLGWAFAPSDLPQNKTAAVQATAAWVVEGRPMPGWNGACFDAKLLAQRSSFLVVCDCIPEDEFICKDLRARRVKAAEQQQYFKEHGFDGTVYMTIRLVRETESELVIGVECSLGSKGAFSYQIVFAKTRQGLKPDCRLGPVA